MSAPDFPSDRAAAAWLYRTLTRTHSPLAAALMAAAATGGSWPAENDCRATANARRR